MNRSSAAVSPCPDVPVPNLEYIAASVPLTCNTELAVKLPVTSNPADTVAEDMREMIWLAAAPRIRLPEEVSIVLPSAVPN